MKAGNSVPTSTPVQRAHLLRLIYERTGIPVSTTGTLLPATSASFDGDDETSVSEDLAVLVVDGQLEKENFLRLSDGLVRAHFSREILFLVSVQFLYGFSTQFHTLLDQKITLNCQ